MLLNAETDYAIRIVTFLADAKEKCEAKSISDGTGVPLRFCLKILSKLVSFEIVKSFKVREGGYVLARPANEITLYEVIDKINGGCELIHCQCGDGGCTNPSGICRFMSAFGKAAASLKNTLEAVTFGDKGE